MTNTKDIVHLVPGNVTLDDLENIYQHDRKISLDEQARQQVNAAADIVEKAAKGSTAIYGVNTGFGKLANVRIHADDTERLQRNLILSHSAGVGDALPANITKLMMVCKIISLARGASGVRFDIISLLQNMVNENVIPLIPKQGSVGASGDLAPLAHMTAVMIGEGEALYKGKKMQGAAALEQAGLAPITLRAKEGLALINGTQFSTANALAHLFSARRAAEASLLSASLSTDAIMGSTAPLRPEIHDLRGHRGQIEVARIMRDLLGGSEIRESHRIDDKRVQDAYCIRCQPQVVGAAIDMIRMAAKTLEIEANAVTDNPLVVRDSEGKADILSGGNFHAEPVAFAADQIAIAMAEIGAISQRRIALMVDPTLSHDLPPFLTPNPGLNSGFMIAEVTSAALMSENKHLANPCSIDSTPTSANQEDHVSMAAHGAVRLGRTSDNLFAILGIEILCACQGIEMRAPLKTSEKLQRAIADFRQKIPPLQEDRFLSPDIEMAIDCLKNRHLFTHISDDILLSF